MPKESIITVFRSTATEIPTGLTFGELAYSDVNGGKFFVGKNDGTSLWVGAGITDGTLATNSQYLIPTQSAVKTYVDGVVGGGSVVNTLNATGGAVTITGDGGAITNVQSGKENTIGARLASASLTGVASFPATDFAVSTAGAVTLTGNVAKTNVVQTFTAFQNFTSGLSGNLTGNATTATNSTQLGGTAANSWALQSWVTTGLNGKANTNGSNATGTWPINITGNAGSASTATTATQVSNALTIGTGLAGTSSTYNGSAAVTVVNTGVLSLNGLTGARTLTGDGGAVIGSGNTAITARLATTGATGVASFSSDNFNVVNGVVTIKDGGITNAELAASTITISTLPISLGGSVTITGTAGEIDVSAAASTITIGLPNDVTISGNLTVNGSVVTTNVENFVVEDPLLMLGTGNSADSVDLGFYSKFVSGSAKYTGLFRDQSFSGKYRLFTDLTEEPTATVNTAHASYAMATLVARIDGGTF